MAESVPIPEPPGYPLIGNLGEFTTSPLADLKRLADTYGMLKITPRELVQQLKIDPSRPHLQTTPTWQVSHLCSKQCLCERTL